jgi:malate synthase
LPRDLRAYARFLPDPLLAALLEDSEPVPGVPGLSVATGLRARHPRIETDQALATLVEVYRAVLPDLAELLHQRELDRAFIDEQTLLCVEDNAGRSVNDPDYASVIGRAEPWGRVVVGPHRDAPELPPVEIPDFLKGEQVTLFGPPDSPRMAINAMNALHRRKPDEHPILSELVASSGQVPRWGADDEDSQTPIMDTFLAATENLMGCYERSLSWTHPVTGKVYELAESGLAHPIKRIPGLALPDGSHLLDGQPLPLHLVDFVLHCWHNRRRPEALVFYVPKLEHEAEAAYMRTLIEATDAAVRGRDAEVPEACVKLLLVFENPRAIFRIREMGLALGPHFLGGSLGWHDFLASTARLFKHDPNYRIPVKADPDIVIKHIRESHRILADSLAPSGALRIGGMYGVLFDETADSERLTRIGFIRDVITQMKRGLTGFWVAHPDFVREGIALVEAWRRLERDPQDESLSTLVRALIPARQDHEPLLAFIAGPDVQGLDLDDPRYARAVLAATIEVSPVIANDDPEEVRYNVFQALQYLADWLVGNGCVALPATLYDPTTGAPVLVRIMDDLATTERSRWELWAEVHHGRVPVELFERILDEELAFIRAGEATPSKRVQVHWTGEAARWYPVAAQLLHMLVTTDEPPEFVPEWMLAFTFPVVRDAEDPWARARELCPGRYPPLR